MVKPPHGQLHHFFWFPPQPVAGKMMRTQLPYFAALTCLLAGSLAVAEGPVKVFVLAGQSNMEGHAKVETFDYIGDDPATAPLLQRMLGDDGKPRVCDGAWISYLTGNRDNLGEGFGKLTAGYGSRSDPGQDGGKIGPEFTFGIAMDEHYEQPVLIIKTAWGGKSLFYDFRPPSAGPYVRTEKEIENDRHPPEDAGHYFRLMIDHTKMVLANIERVCPAYNASQGYEVAGFVWFQGWNDMVNRDAYPLLPPDSKSNRFANYSVWLGDFIRDTRAALNTPDLPFVIGVMGVGGDEANESQLAFREAMAAPAKDSEFAGSVVAVATAPFWDSRLGAIDSKYQEVRQMGYLLRTANKNHANRDATMTAEQQREYLKRFEADTISPEEVALRQRGASNAGYHYLGCAKTFALMGEAFADALIKIADAKK